MKLEQFEKILQLLAKGNPDNLFINNKGLSSMGPLLFYPKEGQEERRDKAIALIEDNFDNPKQILKSLKEYHFSSYYTPENLIDFQIDYIKQNKLDPMRILEPSAGNGAYVKKLALAFPKAEILALEPDVLSHTILASNMKMFRKVETRNITFEDFIAKHNTEDFDLTITNTPFGDYSIKNSFEHDLKHPSQKNVNLFFNTHMPLTLRENGLSMSVTSKGFMDRENLKILREISLEQADFVDAIRLNNQLFKDEKTKVVADLIILRKTKGKTQVAEHPYLNSDVLTIDGTEFHMNRYLQQNSDRVNGKIEKAVFHNRPDLTVNPGETSNSEFLNNLKLPLLSKIEKRTVAPVNTPDGSSLEEENKAIATPVPNNGKKTGPVSVPEITTEENHPEKYTYNLNDDSTAYFMSGFGERTPVSKKDHLLIGSYINLRNEYIALIKDIKEGTLDTAQAAKAFNNFDFQVDAFHFQYGFLGDNKIILNLDKYYSYLSRNVELPIITRNKKTNTYQKNPNFRIENLLGSNLPPQQKKTVVPKPKETDQKEQTPELPLKSLQNKTVEPVNPIGQPKSWLPFEVKEKFPTTLETQGKNLKQLVYGYYDLYGTIDLDFLKDTLKTDLKTISNEALQDRIFYYDIQGVNAEPILYHKFISGDISEKIDKFNQNSLPEYIDTSKAISALEEVKNPKLDINDISFNFESPFIPFEYKKKFFKYLINENVDLIHSESNNKTTIKFNRPINQDADLRYSVELENQRLYSYKRLFQNFADNVYPTVLYTVKIDGKEQRKVHRRATIMAKNLYEELQLQFQDYIASNVTYKETVETNYYKTFLSDVNTQTASDVLSFPKSLEFEPYDHQKSATLYSLMRGTALLDHKVGHGKSLSMGMLSYKMLQHKKSDRIFISTLKAVAPQLQKEIGENFPMLSTFLLTKKNFNAKTRAGTLKHIANSNYDIIVGEHTHLQQIPKSIEYVKEVIMEKLEDIERDLETAKKFGLKETKKIVSGLVKRQNNLEDKLQTTLKKIKEKTTQIPTTFEDTGIDCIMIDECHKFKNIGYTTRHTNVSGLNASTDSQTNLDLEISIRSIHDRRGADRNIFFFSGTPIKNSVTELYAYQRYLTPAELKQKGISNFDAWASIFLKQDMQIEADVFGQPRMHKRFRYFTNMPELSKLYHSFTHISNDQTFKTNNIELLDEFITLDTTPAYDDLKEAAIELGKRNQIPLYGHKKYSDESIKSSYILALNVSRNILVDPMIEVKNGITIPFDETDQIKLHQVAKDVKKRYDESTADKGVNLIFSNIGVYNKSKPYNTYDTLKRILVELHGIPENEIDFAQKAKDENRMHRFQADLRKGDLRIAIGSTQTLGTGTNIQNKIVGIYNLDIPWSPDDFEQRLGRGIRKGNITAEKYGGVQFNTYGYKDTTDIFSYSLNKHKSVFINQIKQLNHTSRTFDDFMTSDNSEWTHEQREAVLIGDMDTFKLVKLDQDLNNLQAEKKMFDIRKDNAQKSLDILKKENDELISKLNQLKKQSTSLSPLLPKVNDDTTEEQVKKLVVEQYKKIYSANPSHNPFLKPWATMPTHTPIKEQFDILNQYLVERSRIMPNANSSLILRLTDSSLLNFNIMRKGEIQKFWYSLEVDTKTKVDGNKQYKFDKTKIAYQLMKLIKQLPRKISNTNFDIDQNLKNIESNRKSLTSVFPKEKIQTINALEKEIKQIKSSKGRSL